MLGTGLLQLTFYISIVVQIITGLVTFGGIFYKLPKQDKVLKDILALETIAVSYTHLTLPTICSV